MLQSLFVLSASGEVLIEKHWRKTTSRSVVDLFLDQINGCDDPRDVPPVIPTSNQYLINVARERLFLLGVVEEEFAPLLVVEFLHRVLDTLAEYFGSVSELTIKENFSTVYQLLEEMCDNGFPLITEPNALKEMITPPSIQNRIVAAVSGRSGVADVLPDGSVSAIPWRPKGLHYNVNSVYFDFVESINCIIGRNGQVTSCSVLGELLCNSSLSGMPDVVLRFSDPNVMVDTSFHPCVRLARFEQERVLSLIPPDGACSLLKYRLDQSIVAKPSSSGGKSIFPSLPIPVYCKPVITFGESQGKVEVMVGAKAFNQGDGRPDFGAAGDIAVVVQFPPTVRSTDLKCNVGAVVCDETTKICRWTIGSIPKDSTPKLTGSFALQQGVPPPDDTLTLLLEFKIKDSSVSKLTLSEIQLQNVSYEPYKYVRSTVKAGSVQVRCP
mmetsp:Transcript_1106/g.1677  ORF Transcript_1106/g.1677 Transcript_1106/m.1677 type:complete len:439 (+) Transcript_1106:37-1353(+)